MTTNDCMPSTYFTRALGRLATTTRTSLRRAVAKADRASLRELNAPLTRQLISAR